MTTEEIGTLLVAYREGKTGPTLFDLVRKADFDRLLQTIRAYEFVRQLRRMSDEDEAMNILRQAGLEPIPVRQPFTQPFVLTLYRVSRGQLKVRRRVRIPAYDLTGADLIHTFTVQLP
jgi:hypothetical protein